MAKNYAERLRGLVRVTRTDPVFLGANEGAVQRLADPVCHVWTGERDAGGYGVVRYRVLARNRRPRTKRKKAHTYYYREIVGSPGDGMTLDHLCNNPACCNPNHLEPVTYAENQRRATNALRRQSGEWETVVSTGGARRPSWSV